MSQSKSERNAVDHIQPYQLEVCENPPVSYGCNNACRYNTSASADSTMKPEIPYQETYKLNMETLEQTKET